VQTSLECAINEYISVLLAREIVACKFSAVRKDLEVVDMSDMAS